MVSHYDRRLGMSDARIEPLKGLVDCGGPALSPGQLRGIERICEQVAKERAQTPDRT
jgi:hypothetical protein